MSFAECEETHNCAPENYMLEATYLEAYTIGQGGYKWAKT